MLPPQRGYIPRPQSPHLSSQPAAGPKDRTHAEQLSCGLLTPAWTRVVRDPPPFTAAHPPWLTQIQEDLGCMARAGHGTWPQESPRSTLTVSEPSLASTQDHPQTNQTTSGAAVTVAGGALST